MRLSRKLGLYGGQALPSLYELFSDAIVVTSSGASSATEQVYSGVSVGDTSSPIWLIVTIGFHIRIVKVTNNTIISLKSKIGTGAYRLIKLNTDSGSSTSNTILKIASSMNSENIYGYCLVGLRFSSYAERVVDRVFENLTIDIAASKYDSGTGTVYVDESDLSSDPDDVYLQCGTSTSIGYLSATRGGSPSTAIMTSGSRAFWRLNNSRYYITYGGSTNASLRIGGIYRLTM